MGLKNFKVYGKIRKKALVLLTSTSIGVTALSGCNKQLVDLNKDFNVAVEPNGDNISVVGISSYNDYQGSQVQIYTESGLVILSSSHQLELLHVTSEESLNDYISSISNDDDIITYHDENMDTTIKYGSWNKRLFDFQLSFNKAMIIRDDNTVSIIDITAWKDFEDDKIQLKLSDGTTILTDCANVKIIDDTNALEGALDDYAASLVGSKDNVYYNGKQLTKTK